MIRTKIYIKIEGKEFQVYEDTKGSFILVDYNRVYLSDEGKANCYYKQEKTMFCKNCGFRLELNEDQTNPDRKYKCYECRNTFSEDTRLCVEFKELVE